MVRECLVLGLLAVGCTGQIRDSARTGEPVPGASDGTGPGSSTTNATGSTGSGGAPSGSTSGGATTQTTGAGGVGGSPSTDTPPSVAAPRVARLTHFQWANSVQDLLRLDQPPAQVAEFTPDAIVGFDTNRSQLRMSGTLREDYERAAEALASQVVEDPAALARLMPADAPADPTARARAFLESFGLRAYRRPLTEQEVSQYLTLFEQASELAPDLEPFSAGVMLSIRLFLQSPYFL